MVGSELITAVQLKLIKNLNQTNKPFIIGSHLWQPPLTSSLINTLCSRLNSTVDIRWKRNDNPIDPSNWLIYKQLLLQGSETFAHISSFFLAGN